MNTPAASPTDYLAPDVHPGLPTYRVPLVRATSETLKGYGTLVEDPSRQPIEIVRWPAAGWRPVDPGTGDEGGTTMGEFRVWWEGDLLFGRNEAVGGEYLLGWSRDPGESDRSRPDPEAAADRSSVRLWHANYHPDGGQLFFPRDGAPFIAPLALPGDDVRPESFVAFLIEGGKGLYIHPNIWHEAIFPSNPEGRFLDIQGKVHARVSCHFPREFGVLLEIPLTE